MSSLVADLAAQAPDIIDDGGLPAQQAWIAQPYPQLSDGQRDLLITRGLTAAGIGDLLEG